MITGKKIKELLNDLDMTAAELSRKTGIPATTLRSMMSKDTTPKIDTLEKIATALGQDILDFVPLDEYAPYRFGKLQEQIQEYDQKYIEYLSKHALGLNHIGRITLLKAAMSMATDPDYTEPDINKMLELWNIPAVEIDYGDEAEKEN